MMKRTVPRYYFDDIEKPSQSRACARDNVSASSHEAAATSDSLCESDDDDSDVVESSQSQFLETDECAYQIELVLVMSSVMVQFL